MSSWRYADVASVRAQVASTCATDIHGTARLGGVILRDHQRDAAARLRDSIQRVGGALLADEVGLGKTYTALAAVGTATPVLVVAPAALADMWRSALDRTGISAEFVSFETLSRRHPAITPPALVIVDEAHHARNPRTHRYSRLAELTRSASVLLLSATPVHNARADLHALLALFLGARAERLTPEELSACIVRRTRADIRDVTMPHRVPPVWLDVAGASEVLQALTEIPPPCPPRDGGDAGALIALSLVRAWASTEAALRAALLRRIARASALGDALATGRHPTRSELLSWVVGEDATQLAFPELVVATFAGDWEQLVDAVERHIGGVRRTLSVISAHADGVDDRRCAILRDIRAQHPGERLVVFSQFADSVRAMFARLRGDGRVAAVTAQGADVAGGPLTRSEVLARFAPRSTGGLGAGRPRAAEEIDLLIATDLLSEGLNLQDASVVVHLDLPWTAARLTQRLGRVWRLGSSHARVYEYALGPPAPAEQLLRTTEILMVKAGAASQAIGDAIAPLLAQRRPGASASDAGDATDPTTAREQLRRVMDRWASERFLDAPRDSTRSDACHDEPPPAKVASIRATFAGWIASVTVAGVAQIIAARSDEQATTDPSVVLEVARAAEGRSCIAAPSRVARAMRAIEAHAAAQLAARDAGLTLAGSRTHAMASTRISVVAAAAPAHRRAAVSRLAARARQTVAASRTAGAERLLTALLADRSSPLAADEAAETWLSRVIELGATPTPNAAPAEGGAWTVHALLLLVR